MRRTSRALSIQAGTMGGCLVGVGCSHVLVCVLWDHQLGSRERMPVQTVSLCDQCKRQVVAPEELEC